MPRSGSGILSHMQQGLKGPTTHTKTYFLCYSQLFEHAESFAFICRGFEICTEMSESVLMRYCQVFPIKPFTRVPHLCWDGADAEVSLTDISKPLEIKP